MEKVKVVVTHPMAKESDLRAIRSVDPRVYAVHAVYVKAAARRFLNPQHASGDQPPFDPTAFDREVGDAEVIFGLNLPRNITQIAPRLRWVQASGAGMDYLLDTGLMEKGIVITNNGGANDFSVAEYCMTLMLMHVKHAPGRVQAQGQRKWSNFLNDDLRRKTLGLVGTGHIGKALAQRAAAFEMTVLGTRRSYTHGEKLPNIHEMYPRDRMLEMLGRCDFVAVTVALTPETRRMIGEPEFRAMKPGCYFVNVSRGPVVDEMALLRALKDGHLGGAGLDVFEDEPLKPESELWDLPNVIVTAHNAGYSSNVRPTDLFVDNLRRYVRGQPLQNIISPERKY